jgi:hypothetical protein
MMRTEITIPESLLNIQDFPSVRLVIQDMNLVRWHLPLFTLLEPLPLLPAFLFFFLLKPCFQRMIMCVQGKEFQKLGRDEAFHLICYVEVRKNCMVMVTAQDSITWLCVVRYIFTEEARMQKYTVHTLDGRLVEGIIN